MFSIRKIVNVFHVGYRLSALETERRKRKKKEKKKEKKIKTANYNKLQYIEETEASQHFFNRGIKLR